MTDTSMNRTAARETQDLLDLARSLLTWDATTGKLWWKVRRHGAVAAGEEAGSINSKGYVTLKVSGVNLLGHRLIWALAKGAWPVGMLDHRNLRKADNWIENLRESTRSGNMANRGNWNSTGLKGVSRKRQRTGGYRYAASLQKDGRRINLGTFATPEEAGQAYVNGAKLHHGEFANTAEVRHA